MTTEQKLKAIIKAQVDAGYDMYSDLSNFTTIEIGDDYMNGFIWSSYESGTTVISILLNTDALKAVYGEYKEIFSGKIYIFGPPLCDGESVTPEEFVRYNGANYEDIMKACNELDRKNEVFFKNYESDAFAYPQSIITNFGWKSASSEILTAYHSDKGNNYEKAIDVAYSLLIKS